MGKDELMENNMKELREKAGILADALPYLRDFNQKIIVIGYLCSNFLTGEEEQRMMQDIALLKSVGMKPIIVHDCRMGADRFRENKRLAKLVELCGVKAVGICGIDPQTLHMTMDNDYIPVVNPSDIDTEMLNLNPMDTAREIAVLLQAEKLIYISSYKGVTWSEEERKILSMTKSDLITYMDNQKMEPFFEYMLKNIIQALDGGVHRAHILSGKMQHALLLELFSIFGVGTVVKSDEKHLYDHEKGRH